MIVIPTKQGIPPVPTNAQRYAHFRHKLTGPAWNGHPWKWCAR